MTTDATTRQGSVEQTEESERFRYEPTDVLAHRTPWNDARGTEVDEELWRIVKRRWRSTVSFAHGTDDEPSSQTRLVYVLENRRGETREETEATLLHDDDWRRVRPDEGEEGDDG